MKKNSCFKMNADVNSLCYLIPYTLLHTGQFFFTFLKWSSMQCSQNLCSHLSNFLGFCIVFLQRKHSSKSVGSFSSNLNVVTCSWSWTLTSDTDNEFGWLDAATWNGFEKVLLLNKCLYKLVQLPDSIRLFFTFNLRECMF